ncbi:hypothetical protein PP175_02645 [Aneurinibacillus sp. Ricciae_BoGa-3]|nr:hypothetical protein [Aneurinibacillus sp. Ricciae_BoGa-3]WCK54932.1 hypothetical protein PP175_02645 [Aneurinibacillus sp. Ricciae_BoGa-3]
MEKGKDNSRHLMQDDEFEEINPDDLEPGVENRGVANKKEPEEKNPDDFE